MRACRHWIIAWQWSRSQGRQFLPWLNMSSSSRSAGACLCWHGGRAPSPFTLVDDGQSGSPSRLLKCTSNQMLSVCNTILVTGGWWSRAVWVWKECDFEPFERAVYGSRWLGSMINSLRVGCVYSGIQRRWRNSIFKAWINKFKGTLIHLDEEKSSTKRCHIII